MYRSNLERVSFETDGTKAERRRWTSERENEEGTNLVQIDPSVPSWNFFLGIEVLEVSVSEAEQSDPRRKREGEGRNGWMSEERTEVRGRRGGGWIVSYSLVSSYEGSTLGIGVVPHLADEVPRPSADDL